jgi:hypothetical protein
MPETTERDIISYDPLSEVTRKERTALLGFSMLGLALVAVPLVPEKFGIFGIEFTRLNQGNFLSLYALLILYYLAAFLIYGLTDYVAWRRLERIRHAAYIRAKGGTEEDVAEELFLSQRRVSYVDRNDKPVSTWLGSYSFPAARLASRLRASFEFALPIGFAVYVMARLLIR